MKKIGKINKIIINIYEERRYEFWKGMIKKFIDVMEFKLKKKWLYGNDFVVSEEMELKRVCKVNY